MRIFTIGFTRKSAQDFFSALARAGVSSLIDVRLHNLSQLAGFAKRDDLSYFARAICGIEYRHMTALAPTAELLEAYRKRRIGWEEYERRFLDLMAARRIETLERTAFEGACLLCSEDRPHRCHRRLVAEYLKERWGEVEILHLPPAR